VVFVAWQAPAAAGRRARCRIQRSCVSAPARSPLLRWCFFLRRPTLAHPGSWPRSRPRLMARYESELRPRLRRRFVLAVSSEPSVSLPFPPRLSSHRDFSTAPANDRRAALCASRPAKSAGRGPPASAACSCRCGPLLIRLFSRDGAHEDEELLLIGKVGPPCVGWAELDNLREPKDEITKGSLHVPARGVSVKFCIE
jgi:hypothetical protein